MVSVPSHSASIFMQLWKWAESRPRHTLCHVYIQSISADLKLLNKSYYSWRYRDKGTRVENTWSGLPNYMESFLCMNFVQCYFANLFPYGHLATTELPITPFSWTHIWAGLMMSHYLHWLAPNTKNENRVFVFQLTVLYVFLFYLELLHFPVCQKGFGVLIHLANFTVYFTVIAWVTQSASAPAVRTTNIRTIPLVICPPNLGGLCQQEFNSRAANH